MLVTLKIILHTQCKKNTRKVEKSLEEISDRLMKWFIGKKVKLNPKNDIYFWVVLISRPLILVTLLLIALKLKTYVTVGNKTNFQSHTENLSYKAIRKLHPLERIVHYMDLLIKYFNECFLWLVVQILRICLDA